MSKNKTKKRVYKPNQGLQAVMDETNTPASQWEVLDGPDSGCGVEYWFKHKKTGQEAYVCIDQGEVISLDISDV